MSGKKCSFHVRRLFLFLLSAVIALSCLLIPVSDAYAEENDAAKGYFTFLYDNSNGLPTSEANAVAQTNIGFIWIGGYSGLTRYEGTEFHHFESSTGINSVNCLYVDSKDRLWIGTNDSGIAVRQNAQFQFWGRNEGLHSLSVRAICEDAAGNIVFASTEGMGYIDSDGTVRRIEDPRIKEKYVRRLKADKDGIIYGVTMDNCFFTLENLELTSFYNSENVGVKDVVSITPDPNEKGRVYLGTGSSKIIIGNMFDGMRSTRTISAAPHEFINDICFASDNKIWVVSNNGLGYFDKNMKYMELKNSAMTSSITSIMEDREGNLWCASSRQGVMKVVRSPFVDITGISGLDRVVANTTCIYQDDLYIGTDVGLQLLDKNYNIKSNVLTELLEGVRIRSIKADSSGNLWLCTYSTYSDYGLICYHGDGTYTTFNEASGMVSSKIRTLTELSDGTIAVASSGGVNLIKDGRVIDTYNEDDGITNTEILSIAEGDNGSIYFGSDGGGLYIIKDGKLRCFGLDNGLKSQVIMQLHKDEQRGVYWVVTGNSIAYMKNEQIYTLTNFPYSNNFDMQFDNQGGIWILSSNGIYFVNGDNLLSNESLVYSFYDIRSGLPSIATANSRNYISPDGTLYIAGGSGVSSININTAREGKNNVKLTVPFVEIDGEEIFIREGDTIRVPSDCNRFTIYAYAMTYAHNPQVSYYIEGFDKEPIVVPKHELKPISFTRPHSGEYVFHMSIIDVMTEEELNSIAVNIVVEKAFYENWWFWMIIVGAVALIVFLTIWIYIRRKMRKLEEKEKENRAFIREIIQVFAKSIDVKDEYTNGHSFRVAIYTKMIAEKVGYSEADVEKFYNIGLMHDIGKILVPNEILNKPGRLSDDEFVEMKKHATNGYDILKEVEALPELALGAGFHHERMDGKGYPFGKKADEIPPVAQMIAVADTFDAMYSTRPYRPKMPIEKVIAELKRVSGTQLNEKYVNALLELIEEGKVDEVESS
ncbi:MAG: HD domain-containing protein [Oscillospiraceae bacterium]|nr:HD domain-containing protein [Oscillospiraceae bacterium]